MERVNWRIDRLGPVKWTLKIQTRNGKLKKKKKKVQAKHNHKTIKSFGNLQNGSQSSSINLTFSFVSSFAKKKKKQSYVYQGDILLLNSQLFQRNTGRFVSYPRGGAYFPPPTHSHPQVREIRMAFVDHENSESFAIIVKHTKIRVLESNTPLRASKRQTMQEGLTIITRWKRT